MPKKHQAARLRASNLKDVHREEKPKPPRRYEIGQTIIVNGQEYLVKGFEWGGDYREYRRDVWIYKCKPTWINSSETTNICEDHDAPKPETKH